MRIARSSHRRVYGDCVEPDPKTFDHFMNLAVLLEALLHRRIELVTTDALSPYSGPHFMGEVEYVALAA